MKGKYSFLIKTLIVEFSLLNVLKYAGIKIQIPLALNALITLILIAPILALLTMLGRDDRFSIRVRRLFKFLSIFMVFGYLAGLIAEVVVLIT